MDKKNNTLSPSDKNNPYKLLNIEIREKDMYNTMKEDTVNFISNVFI